MGAGVRIFGFVYCSHEPLARTFGAKAFQLEIPNPYTVTWDPSGTCSRGSRGIHVSRVNEASAC